MSLLYNTLQTCHIARAIINTAVIAQYGPNYFNDKPERGKVQGQFIKSEPLNDPDHHGHGYSTASTESSHAPPQSLATLYLFIYKLYIEMCRVN